MIAISKYGKQYGCGRIASRIFRSKRCVNTATSMAVAASLAVFFDSLRSHGRLSR